MAASRSFNQRTFEDYDPNVEWSRDAEAEAVRISLPGFKREEIRVLVDNHGHLRTRGERAIAGNRWGRFQKDFKLPDNCNVDGIRAKFENETLTITLPKKTPSPPAGPVTPQTSPLPEPPRRPSAVPSQKLPPALAEPAARPPAPPTVPAATLAPAPSQKPPGERRPSMPRKPAPAPEEEPSKGYYGSGGASAATKPQSSPPAAVTRPGQQEEEERKRMEREAAGKMAEDRKPMMQDKAKEQAPDEAAPLPAEMALARQPRPISTTRGLLMNAAVAAVLLLAITVYVWHTLRNATGGAGGHGHLGAGSYGDEM